MEERGQSLSLKLKRLGLAGGKAQINVVEERGHSANPKLTRFGLAGGKAQINMVELDEKTSNSLLEVLEDWDTVLRAEEIFKHPALRGPRP